LNSLSKGFGASILVSQAVVDIITCIFNSLVAFLVAFVRGIAGRGAADGVGGVGGLRQRSEVERIMGEQRPSFSLVGAKRACSG
jgi:hypothetical protein